MKNNEPVLNNFALLLSVVMNNSDWLLNIFSLPGKPIGFDLELKSKMALLHGL